MGRSKKLTECWDEILKLWKGAGALRWLITSTGSEHRCGGVAGVTSLISSFSKPKTLWSLLLQEFSKNPLPRHLVNLVSSPASDEERAHMRPKWKRARHPKASAFFFSLQIFAEGKWREPGERGAYCSLSAHTTLKFRLAGAISPA